MAEKIKAVMVFEMIGRPQKHLEDTLEKFLETLGKEEGTNLVSKNIHDARPIEEKDKEGKIINIPEERQMFSTFTEVELEAETIFHIMRLCFKYMPAHIDVIEPTETIMNNLDISSLLTEIITKLHNYDAIAKAALMNNQLLTQKLRELHSKAPSNSGITFSLGDKEEKETKKVKKTIPEKSLKKKTRKNIRKK